MSENEYENWTMKEVTMIVMTLLRQAHNHVILIPARTVSVAGILHYNVTLTILKFVLKEKFEYIVYIFLLSSIWYKKQAAFWCSGSLVTKRD